MTTENPQLFGVWKAYKSENMAAVMEKAGAPWIARKMGANATPTVTVTRIDDRHIGVSTKTMMFNSEQVFDLDGIVEGSMPYLKEKQAYIVEWQDNRLVTYEGQAGSDVKNSGIKNIRSLEPNGDMLLTVVYGDVVAYRWFKKEA